jgi:LAO/AO transport system kinase
MRLPDPPEIEALLRRFGAGSVEALARLLSLVENHPASRREIVSRVLPIDGQPIVVGVTGPAGVGKSTLVSRLLVHFKKELAPLAALGFDPSSKLSGGALLGDRVRMSEHELDGDVFIRSMASRGHGGGTGRRVHEALALLSAFGFKLVIVETVGAGQGETEIMQNADVIAVVVAPGLGDEVQAMKAGLLEIGDVVVVNKADLPGADLERAVLLDSLSLGGPGGRASVEVCSTIATDGTGVPGLSERLLEIHRNLERDGSLAKRRQERARAHFEGILRERWTELLDDRLADSAPDALRLDTGDNPYDAADRFIEKMLRSTGDHGRAGQD